MRRITVALLVAATAMSGAAHALGLGKLQTSSALSEPFSGRIDLLGTDFDDVDRIKVGIAGAEQFERAGMPRPLELSKLQFEIVVRGKQAHIEISSREPINEPFLNFLLEMNWPEGRMVREYTALLDPPTYDPATQRARRQAAAAARVQQPTEAVAAEPAEPAGEPEAAPEATAVAPAPATAAGTLGRETEANDTLWSIASSTRPDPSVSVQQMMIALLRANPEAFARDNINMLKRGYVLRIPDQAEAAALSQGEALAEVQRQHGLWEEYRLGSAAQPVARVEPATPAPAPSAPEPEPVPTPAPAPPVPAAKPEDDARLKLVAPGAGTGTADTAVLTAENLEKMSLDELKQQLALAEERVAAQDQESTDMVSRVDEEKQIVETLKRLVTLRESELAALQAKQVEQPEPGADTTPSEQPQTAQTEPEPTPPAPEPPAEEFVPPAESPGFVARILAAIPGGIVTAIAGLIVVLGGLGWVLWRRRPSEAPAEGARGLRTFTTREPEIESEDTTISAAAGTADETPTRLSGDTTAEEFMSTAEFDSKTITNVATVTGAGAAAVATAAVAAPPAEDPLAEVNVYLAYERFEQAEQLVKQAIDRDPSNLNYKMRLLEVYYSSNNKVGYENAARDVYDATGGSGEQWDSAVAMWNEMSPERALFAAGAVTEAVAAAPASQFVDITSDAGEVGASTMTIKPGESTDDSLRSTINREFGAETSPRSEMLDITGGEDAGADAVFDITSAGPSEEPSPVFDLTGVEADGSAAGEVFDLTSGGNEMPPLEFDLSTAETPAAGDEVLDVTAGDAVDVLDITGGVGPAPTVSAGNDDLLDVTHTGELSGFSQSDLLNVTSPGTLTPEERAAPEPVAATEPEPEVFDITSAAEESADNLIEFDISVAPGVQSPAMRGELDQPVEEEIAFDISVAPEVQPEGTADAPALDLDIGTLSLEDTAGQAAEADADVMFDVTATADKAALDEGLQIDIGDEGLSIDGSSGTGDAEIGIDTSDLSAMVGDLDLEIIDDKQNPDDTLALQGSGGGLIPDDDDVGIDLDLTDEFQSAHVDTVRMDQSATMTSTRGEEQTVIMPRAANVEEQSQDDEVDTKLNLAKAYIELGDGDGARAILDEVVASGNPGQRQEAKRLLEQL